MFRALSCSRLSFLHVLWSTSAERGMALALLPATKPTAPSSAAIEVAMAAVAVPSSPVPRHEEPDDDDDDDVITMLVWLERWSSTSPHRKFLPRSPFPLPILFPISLSVSAPRQCGLYAGDNISFPPSFWSPPRFLPFHFQPSLPLCFSHSLKFNSVIISIPFPFF
eukprot:RCo020847